MGKKLFIIGNGFDLFHHLPTTYYDLREYFRRPLEYHDWLGVDPDAYYQNPITFIDSLIMNTVFDDYEISAKRVAVFTDKSNPPNTLYKKYLNQKGIPLFDKSFLWSDFEGVLGRIDFSEYLTDDDYGPDFIRHSFDYLQNSFTKWINSIDISNITANETLKQLFDCSQDLFLTFNYTTTLEEVYHVPVQNICHIHGKCGEKLVFGHSGINEEDFLQKNAITGFEDFAEKLFDELTKKDTVALKQHRDFFERMVGIEDIYVIGFSFSSCDLRYVAEICHRATTANWHLNDYDSEEKRQKYQNIIRTFGALGNVVSYHLPADKNNQPKPRKNGIGKSIRAMIRLWMLHIDPIWERMLFGFDPKNEHKFFKKPYRQSIIFALLIFAILLTWTLFYPFVWIFDRMRHVFKKLSK